MPITYVRKTAVDPILLLAAKMEGRLRAAFLDAVAAVKGSISEVKLREAVAAGDVAQVTAVLALDEKFVGALQGIGLEGGVRSLRTAVQEVFAAGAKAAEMALPKTVRVGLSFDLLNPHATNHLNGYTFELIQQITGETREAIRQVILRAFKEGGHPYEQAREIKNAIGLTASQEQAVTNYRLALESGNLRNALGRALRDGRYDRSLLRALANGTSLSQEKIDAMVARYRQRYIDLRARTIARTESIRASQMGQAELWRQARQQGLLGEETRRVWIASMDDRTCEVCAGLNGKTAPLDGSFPGGYGYPPTHPNCRCSTALVTKPKSVGGNLFRVEEDPSQRKAADWAWVYGAGAS